MDKTILFYWSKGSKTRLRILMWAWKCQQKKEPCYLNQLSEAMGISHVGIKKHLELLLKENYIKEINPSSKPVFLELTEKGKKIIHEFKLKK